MTIHNTLLKQQTPKLRWKYITLPIYFIFDALWRFLRLVFFLLIISLVASLVYGYYYIKQIQIPQIDFDNLNNFAQSSIITDRDGNELFRFFTEDRQYVKFKQISPHLINAIVATEDQTFWTNPGLDPKGIIRAMQYNSKQRLNGQNNVQGASTITQQLIKNVALDPEQSIERKIKELILSFQLNEHIKQKLYNSSPDKEDDYKRLSKEMIIEMYLNYIFLGNYAYGIQSASQRYFNTDSSQLDILQSSIIASIPKAPSRYNLYTKRNNIMGYRMWYQKDQAQEIILDQQNITTIQNLFKKNLSLHTDQEIKDLILSQWVMDFFHQMASTSIIKNSEIYDLYYIPGRKDYVLGRMYQEWYITQSQLIDAFSQAIGYAFSPMYFPIQSPHFVYYAKDFLLRSPLFQSLGIDEQLLSIGWYTIITTLDSQIQSLTQQQIDQNMYLLNHHGWSNRSLLYTDSLNGDVLAYIGSIDFRNEQVQGQIDMVRAKRQIGSTIKPLIYANLFKHYPLWPNSFVTDLPITLEGFTPQNADGSFAGKIKLKQALAWSRNIPAIKVFKALWGESAIKPYLQQLGMNDIKDDRNYWFSLGIGSAEISMLQLNQAYMHLSQNWPIPLINPILEIKDKHGTTIYKKPPPYKPNPTQKTSPMEGGNQRGVKLIPNGASRLIRRILTNKIHAPAGRASRLTMPLIEHYAIKTGTSNMRLGTKRVPRDGRIVFYNGSRVLTIRGGNTDASPMGDKWYGANINAPLLHDLVKVYREKDLLPDTDKIRPDQELITKQGSDFYRHPLYDETPQRVNNILND